MNAHGNNAGAAMATRTRHTGQTWNESIPQDAHPPKGPQAVTEEEIDKARAAGIPLKLVRNIHCEINRDDFLRLIQFLEERATSGGNYYQVAQAVKFAEMLRDIISENDR